MKITHLSLKIEKIALQTPFVTALRRVESVDNVIITLHTDTPLIGEGAAPATKAITGEDLKSISQTIEKTIFPLLRNQTFELKTLLEVTHQACKGNSSAKAAVEIALYDLASKNRDQSLVEFLHGTACKLQTAVTISLNEPDIMSDDAAKAFARGFDILKIKVGSNDGQDIQRIKAVSNAAPQAKLLVDANQAWSLETSLNIINALKDAKIELIEQPVKGKDIEGLKQITQQSSIPILADEAVFTFEDAKKVIEQQAADLINIKLMKCGGISKAIEIIEYCQAHHVKCMMGSMLEGPVSINAAAQLVMAYPEAFSYIDLDSPLLYKKIPACSGLKFFNNSFTLERCEPYSLYMLQCSDGTYYTGIAKDVEKRIIEHNSSPTGAKYTRNRRPVTLVYEERHTSKSAALKREIAVKKMTRIKKEKLVKSRFIDGE